MNCKINDINKKTSFNEVWGHKHKKLSKLLTTKDVVG